MYTKLDDQKDSKAMNEYMALNSKCSIKDLRKVFKTSNQRLRGLQSDGYLVLPKITIQDIVSKRKPRNYVSVRVGREEGRWKGY
jgi:hypothetical protein